VENITTGLRGLRGLDSKESDETDILIWLALGFDHGVIYQTSNEV
jgi:hypothetical protein